jgi:uncharacterized membrane protein (UPF0127 family)
MALSRELALLAAAGALLAQAAAGWDVIRPLPASRLARQVVVYREGVEQARISAPGRRDVALPCTHVPGRTETLEVQVTSLGPTPPADCHPLDPGQVQQVAAEGRTEKVQFVDTLGEQAPGTGEIGPVALPDGRRAVVASALVSAGNIVCLFPAPQGSGVAMPGARVRMWGTAFRAPDGSAAVLVDGLRPEPAEGRPDEPPWQVTARWGRQQVLDVSKPGDYELTLPCANMPGAQEEAGVRVREFRVADIQVDGHPASVELAVTTQAMSYGLQGRAGLDTDCGMLFCFPEPTVPQFVMKSVSFPLSIAFIRDDGVITNIERLNPGDWRSALPVVPVSYVLEMQQGWFGQHGVAPGKVVVIP